MDKFKLIGVVISICINLSAADLRYGTLVGSLSTNKYNVQGNLYVITSTKLRIRHFSYSGEGPDAFFYFGLKNGPSSTPSGQGRMLPDQNGRTSKLAGASNADIVLKLPSGVTVDQIQWFSVWCKQAGVDFGSLIFPASVNIPTSINLGTLSQKAHGVSSGPVTALNSRQIEIQNFNYDGLGPDSFFWVGTGTPSKNGTAIPNELGNMDILKAYSGATIKLTLPTHITVHDIDYLSVWCKRAESDFGHVVIGKNLNVLPYTMNIEGYYGKLVGDLKHYAHDVRGTVYLVDDNRIRIRNFYYDGTGPDAYFWLGSTSSVDTNGTIIPDEHGMTAKLGKYEDADIVLTLPPGRLATAVWFSVWCKRALANFGDIYFPKVINVPAPLVIGEFSKLAHDVRSGQVTILDMKTIRIENLYYDGFGPDAYFWIGTGSPSTTGWKVPDENGSLNKLKKYTGQTVTLTLPDDFTFMDIDWLSMWCIAATQNFGNVVIPDNLLVPPKVTAAASRTPLSNCENLHEYFNIAWQVEGDFITYEFQGALEDNAMGYMTFGISGSKTSSKMVGSDVFVVSYDSVNGPKVTDYTINAYAQCSQGTGACPDTMNSGSESSSDVDGFQIDGITTVRFKRALNTTDLQNDKAIPNSGETYIVWAMGRLSQDGLVTKHNLRLQGDKKIDFRRTAMNNCPTVKSRNPPVKVDPWLGRTVSGSMFTARIGPAGPENRGYAAITKQQSWGIAWYINDQLIPEILVQRGMEYTFLVEGGDDPSNKAKYHPFYITSDPFGGYEKKTESEKALTKVFAGVNATGHPTAAGRYCEFKTSSTSSTKTTYAEYFKSLVLECVPGERAVLKWTPDRNTPDTVYYQCFTHRYLGWKIRVQDYTISSVSGLVSSLQITVLTIIMSVVAKYM